MRFWKRWMIFNQWCVCDSRRDSRACVFSDDDDDGGFGCWLLSFYFFRERLTGERTHAQIPDELTNHYLKSAGVSNPDARVTRLVSLAAERFVQQVADDAYRCAVQRNQAQLKEKKEKGYDLKDKRLVLECEDLAAALRDYGVSLHKPPYYVGSAPAEEEEEEKEEEKPSKKRSKR